MLSELDLIASVVRLVRVLWEDLSLCRSFPSVCRQMYCKAGAEISPCARLGCQVSWLEESSASSGLGSIDLEILLLLEVRQLLPTWGPQSYAVFPVLICAWTFQVLLALEPKNAWLNTNLLHGFFSPSCHLLWMLAETTFGKRLSTEQMLMHQWRGNKSCPETLASSMWWCFLNSF